MNDFNESGPQLFPLHPDDIDTSGAWIFWPAPPCDALRSSLELAGQTTPALVERLEGESGWALVTGYKRVLAQQEAGRDVLVRAVTLSSSEKAYAYLSDNLHGTQAPLCASKALPVLRYLTPLVDKRELNERVAPLLGMTFRDRAWKRLNTWVQCIPSGHALDDSLRHERIPLDVVDIFQKLSELELASLAPFFSSVRWSVSAARQFTTQLFELSRGKDMALDALLNDSTLPEIPERELSPKDMTRLLLEELRRMRFPHFSELQRRFTALREELGAGASWRIEPCPGFEENSLSLQVTVKDQAELKKLAVELDEMAESPAWERLLTVGETT